MLMPGFDFFLFGVVFAHKQPNRAYVIGVGVYFRVFNFIIVLTIFMRTVGAAVPAAVFNGCRRRFEPGLQARMFQTLVHGAHQLLPQCRRGAGVAARVKFTKKIKKIQNKRSQPPVFFEAVCFQWDARESGFIVKLMY